MPEASAAPSAAEPLVIGRYALFDELAVGGMATVHLGRLLGPVGFGRTVAVKRLKSHFLSDREFVAMFIDEARVASRIRHPNVVPMVDVVQSSQGLLLVMEYIHGESLSRLLRGARLGGERIPVRVVASIMCGVLLGLHAAHETKGAGGQLLGVVHRDVSPQNVMVGADGAARVFDFGIAKAVGRAQVTREGQIKGKLAYMAPEQVRGQADRRTDVFAASVCLWEALAGRRLHEGMNDIEIVTRVVSGGFPPPSAHAPGIPPALDAIVMKGLAADPNARFATAREMALEIERAVGVASVTEVSALVERLAHDHLAMRTDMVAAIERVSSQLVPSETGSDSAMRGHPPVDERFSASFGAAQVGGGVPPAAASARSMVTATTMPTPITTRHAAAVLRRPVQSGMTLPWMIALVLSSMLAVIGGTLGSWALLRHRPVPASAASSGGAPRSAPATSIAATPSAGMPPSSSASPSVASAGASSTASPTSWSTSSRSGPASSPPPASGRAAPSPPPPPKPSAEPKKKDCEIPYTIDEAGHRHYKPECLDNN